MISEISSNYMYFQFACSGNHRESLELMSRSIFETSRGSLDITMTELFSAQLVVKRETSQTEKGEPCRR